MRIATAVWVGLLALAGAAFAQTYTGGVQGKVVDPAGAFVVNSTVVATNVATRATRTSHTDNAGWFRIDGLQPGDYEVRAEAPGFAPSAVKLPVPVAEIASTRILLSVAGAPETIEVRETVRDTETVVIDNPVSEYEVQNIPLANRSFANIAYIAPMTAPVEPSDPTKARITAVSFAGSSGLNVDLSVDGGDNNDDYIGGFLQNYSPESIREFNVRTAQFDPDTSRTNGGSIVISTRSGTNEWHGSGTGLFRSPALNARNALDNPEPNPKQPYRRQDFVGAVGGPLKRNRLWLFTSFEYNHEDASVAYSAFSLSQFQALSQFAAAGQIPGVSSLPIPSSVPTPFRDSLFNARLDWQQSQRSHWFLRYSQDRNRAWNDLVQQGALPSTGFRTLSNYSTLILNNTFSLSDRWLASTVLEASLFDHTKLRNSNLGFALAFPFSTTVLTTSGFETFGDNQFVTAITAFPVEREQQKYQLRYDIGRSGSKHSPKFGVNLIHEPVLQGRFSGNAERLIVFDSDPGAYATIAPFFTCDPNAVAGPAVCPAGATVTDNPARDGAFSQSIRRLGFYAQDNWRITPQLVMNYGLRYDTTFGLFIASGHDQNQNAALQALRGAGVNFASSIPRDYRRAVAPRLGLAYAPGNGNTVFRAGIGLYYNDLAQSGWAEAFQAVNGGANPPSAIIDPNYHTPYALEASAAVQRSFGNNWQFAAQFEHQGGVHQYRRYEYIGGISLPAGAPDTSVFRSDNRSSYNGGSLILQHRGGHYDLTAHYTFAHATTWGATVGELFDYVNGVTDALHPFGPGDHGPSGEDIRHRFVLSGVFDLPAHFQFSTIAQFESARPYTMFTPVDINGDGNVNDRAVVNGVQTTLDQFRGTPFSQIDVRVARDFPVSDRMTVRPFLEVFNLLNRTNPGNNYIPDISLLVPPGQLFNATSVCADAGCGTTRPIRSLSDLRVPAGALGDFFGPGTTVGIPFAAQIGVRVSF